MYNYGIFYEPFRNRRTVVEMGPTTEPGTTKREVTKMGAAGSSKINYPWQAIPWAGLRRVLAVFQEGIDIYKSQAVNGLNLEPAINNPGWQIERYGHAQEHLTKWFVKRFQTGLALEPSEEDDLAKAVWYGLIMMGIEEMEKERKCGK